MTLDLAGVACAEKVRALYFERCAGPLPHLTHEIPMSAAFHYDSFRDYALAWLPKHDGAAASSEAEAVAASEHAIRAFWKPLGGGGDVRPSDAARRSLKRRSLSSPTPRARGVGKHSVVAGGSTGGSAGSEHRAWASRSGPG